MKVSNKNNIPQAIVNIVSKERKIVEGRYSVTEILNGTREIILTRRHKDELEVDASDMIATVFGSAVHKVLELETDDDKAEIKLEHEILPGKVISGRIDVLDKDAGVIEDYKTSSVYKIIHGKFDDWKKQGLLYAWLAYKNGILINKVLFHVLIKDWKKRESRYKKNYPRSAFTTVEFAVTSLELRETEEFVIDKLKELEQENADVCSDDERWNDIKCKDYCPVRMICDYGRSLE